MALAVVTAAALLWFIQVSERRLSVEEFAAIRPRLYGALVGDLLAPVVAWFVLGAIGRRRARKAQESP